MIDGRGDQAAGLRRLFDQQASRLVAFVAGSAGVGKSLLVANLAASLAQQGQQVLVLDEDNKVAAYSGVSTPHDWWQVIAQKKTLSDVLLMVAPKIRILPIALAVKNLAKLTPYQQDALRESFAEMSSLAQVILINTSLDHPLGFSPLGLASQETVVVLSAVGNAVTDAYSLVKKASLVYSHPHFRILVSKARTSHEAHSLFENMARVSHQRGLARLEWAGFVPLDENLRQASRLYQPVEGLFPHSAAAKAYREIAHNILSWTGSGEHGNAIEPFVSRLLALSQVMNPQAIYA